MKQKLLIKSSSITLMMIILIILILNGRDEVLLLNIPIIVMVEVVCLVLTTDYLMHYPPSELYQKRNQFVYHVIDYLHVIVSAFFLMQIIFSLWFFPATVNQTSMNPTLYGGEKIIVSHKTKHLIVLIL
jgi:hypothetical protein